MQNYEPKLIKKKWTLENCFSLSTLVKLKDDHINSMLFDLTYSFLKLYNLSAKFFYDKERGFNTQELLIQKLSE